MTDDLFVFPVSFAQQRLWLLDQLTPGSPAYHLVAALRLRGPLDLSGLYQSLDAIIHRHETLRTTFADGPDGPLQVVHPPHALPLPLLDLRGWDAAARDSLVAQLAARHARQPFDLARGPLLRTALLRLDAAEHVLLLAAHHIIADEWSIGVFVRELATLYDAARRGHAAPLDELPIQYADYAVWQREWLLGPGVRGQGSGARGDGDTEMQLPTPNTQHPFPIQEELVYWHAQLGDRPAPPELPTDYPRPMQPRFRGARHAVTLAPPLSAALRELSRAAGVTLFMTLLAAFQALLARYTDQDDIAVGTPIANRTQSETEGLIGCFVNTLVLRSDLVGDPPFAEVLRRVREICLGAYAHAELPFEQLVAALQPARDLGRNPLFQVLFVLQSAPLRGLELAGLRLDMLDVESTTAKFDLTLALEEDATELRGWWEYDTDLFAAATIERMAAHWQTLLGSVAARPEQRLWELPLLTAAEREQVLVEWNATDSGVRGRGSGVGDQHPDSWCIHQLFEAQVVRTSDAAAVVFDRPTTNDQRSALQPFSPSALHPFTQHLTYQELNRLANQVAHYLQSLGVGPEVRVAIGVERSPELVVGLLGILKAGGAYVPLDPAYPAERLAFMLEDSQAAVLITTTDDRPTTNDDQRPTTNDQRPTAISDDRSTYGHDISCPNGDQRRPTAISDDRSAYGHDISCPNDDQRRPTAISDDRSTYGHDISCPNDDQRRPATTDQRTDTIYRVPNDDQRRPATCDLRPATCDRNPKSKIVHLDADWPTIAAEPPSNPPCCAMPANLAYVIYTSGSTGRPKGVAISHRSAVAMLAWAGACFTPADRAGVLASTSICFDLAVFELFVPLCWGGAVVLVENVLQLPGSPVATHVTLINSVPSAIAELLRIDGLPPLRVVNLAGEPLPNALAQQLYQHGAIDAVFNLYGPTEDTTYSTWALVQRGAIEPPAIGRPIANTQVYLLDRHLQPVPIGVAGELYLGGAGLARGYLGRPALTAAAFIPNPFAQVLGVGCWVLEDSAPNTRYPTPNTRLYRTGDLARYRADGSIMFLGRIDQQVKLRGFRIEPGEIEALLGQHPAVRDAVVLAREDAPGDVRLVAYVVPKIEDRGLKIEDSGSDARDPLSSILYLLSSELRYFLKDKLPDYMIPTAFVLLEALPLTPNGKIDRRALPAPDWSRAAPGHSFVAPRTPLEELLAGMWSAVLGVAHVGVEDNFFALGGHSLLATRLVSQLRDTLQVELPLRAIFEAPMLAALAARLESDRWALDAQPPPMLPAARGDIVPLSFAQRQLWFFDQLAPGAPIYTMPTAVELRGRLDIAVLAHSLGAITRRHETLRTTFEVVDGQPFQVVHAAAGARLPIIDLRGLPAAGKAVARRLATAEARRPFDLARGPLIRATLLRLDEETHILLLTMHHIISDIWSMGVLIGELAALYTAGSTGTTAALPPLPIQYADYAIWQRQWLQRPGARGQGDRETRRQGDRETRSTDPQHPTPNTQHPTPNTQHPTPNTQHPTPNTQHPTPIQAQLAYWKRQLGDSRPVLTLPADRPRPAVQTFRGATHSSALPLALTEALAALSRQAGATLFMTLLAAFQTLLYRYTAQDDIAVGSPVANRTRTEVEGLIGLFANTLVLRAELSGKQRFRDLLGTVREVTLGAYAHQDLPFELLVEELQPTRDLSHTPLFQVVFTLQNAPMPALALPGLTMEMLEVETGTARSDLALSMVEGDRRLNGVWEYSTDLFDAPTIARMAGHFQTLLAGIAADPARSLADLPLLTEAERRQLLVEWNATGRVFRGQGSGVRSESSDATLLASDSWCIQDMFAAQAARSPDAVALVFSRPTTNDQRPPTNDQRPTTNDQRPTTEDRGWKIEDRRSKIASFPSSILDPRSSILSPQSSVLSPEQLTYRELNERANRLAHHLRALGVGPETLVGLHMQRSPELVVGLLGILKAGGAYLPLDPDYPPERIAFMLEDSQAAVVITTNDQRRPTNDDRPTTNDRPTGDHGRTTYDRRPATAIQNPKSKIVNLDADWPTIAAASPSDPECRVTPGNLAYVIYTSGSTGRPKGVMIEHGQIANTMLTSQATFGLTERARIPCIASFSFDIALFELLGPLLVGGTSVMLTRPQVLDLPGFARTLEEITFIHALPSLMRQIVSFVRDHGLQDRYHNLGQIFMGGDLIPVDLVKDIRAAFASARIYLGYGPTENAIMCSNYTVPPDRAVHNHIVGTPMHNMVVRLCDAHQNLVPIGVPGEIYIGGAGVARGYLNRPELTAERFLPNPFWGMGDGGWGMEDSIPIPHPPSPIPRLYRTGDLARYLPDGNLEFVGRVDEQVKVRGFRVELGEVEAALGQHPGVREAVVVVREDAAGENSLVAYIVPAGTGDGGLGIGNVAPIANIPELHTSGAGVLEDADRAELWPSVSEYPALYDEMLYYAMSRDELRLAAYKIVIERAVKDKIVLEIGPGREAILSRFCVEAGAKKVYAVEIADETYASAQECVRDLGLEDKISLIHGDSTSVQLPEKVDVCVSAIFGSIGSSEGAITILNDARRFLKAGGTMIPCRSVTRVAAVALPDEILANPRFSRVPAYYAQRLFDYFGHPFDLRLCIKDFPDANIISNSGIFEDLDFSAAIEPESRCEVHFTISRSARLDGFLVWLNLYIAPDQVMDILAQRQSLLPLYFPVFSPGIDVVEGDAVRATCIGTRSEASIFPDYAIKGTVIKRDARRIDFDYRSDHHSKQYRQTPFYELLFKQIATPEGDHVEEAIKALRDHLKARLPSSMLPSAFVFLESMPVTHNGKLDRRALPDPRLARAASRRSYTAPQTALERRIAAVWQEVLQAEQVGIHDNFFDLGGHSLLMVRVHSRLRDELKQDLSMIDLFQYPTIHSLASYLSDGRETTAALREIRERAERQRVAGDGAPAAGLAQLQAAENRSPAEGIAIIGMAGRFPGAADVEQFWRNLCAGVESISAFSDQELLAAGVPPSMLDDPSYVKSAATLDEVATFDATFFGYTPREAELIDPQQRVFLECAWAALEHAGYAPETYAGPIGVFAGAGLSNYLLFNLLSNQDQIDAVGHFQAQIGNSADFVATRVSYKLNLKGPSVAVQTACSTSLVAAHLACQSLAQHQCDMALAGGVAIGTLQKAGYRYYEGGIASPDGHCRAFDADAQGTVPGSGAGVVVLKRLRDALADGDTVYAVIRGSALNNDGALKVGYTAPSVSGQAEVIASAQAIAGVDPDTVTYVEAHGTGTALGDPIEIAALTQVFRAGTQRNGFCAIGSLKTNIGHPDAAAGVAGLIKTALALTHRALPPSLHFERPNPAIDFVNSPFYVNTKLTEWPDGRTPRRAGVSSFGIGGTNAHMVLEEAPPRPEPGPARPWQLLLLSARTATALEAATTKLAAHLRQHPEHNLADVAYTLQVGRRAFGQRLALVCRDREDALDALESLDSQRLLSAEAPQARPVVFMFPGGGAQRVGMGLELYQGEPVFRAWVDRCAELLAPHLGLDVRAVLYPDERRTTNDERRTTNDERPTTDDYRPTTNDPSAPLRAGQRPTTTNDGTGTIYRAPTTSNERPTTNDDRSPYGHDISCPQRRTTNDQRPTTNNERPTTNDQRPTTNDQRPTSEPAHPFTPSPLHPFTPSPLHPFTPSPTHPPSQPAPCATLVPQSPGLRRTAIALPALFTVEYALARLWMSWGVQPQALIGHSLGEYVAACLAGVFSLEDALALVAARGRLMQRLPDGAMLSVSLPEAQVWPLLDGQLALAAINAPSLCVVSGPLGEVAELERTLRASGVECHRVAIDVAAHSTLVTPILEEFRQLAATLDLREPRLPLISNVSGTWMTAAQATDPGYWARHLRQTVRFADGLAELLCEPERVLLEVGPGRTLSALAKRQPARPQAVLASMRHPNDEQPELACLLTTLGRLWLAGSTVDWASFTAHERRRRLPLPTYPFERQRYWIEPRVQAQAAPARQGPLAKNPDSAQWFYVPFWKPAPAPGAIAPDERSRWLVFADAHGLGARLVERLRDAGQEVVSVMVGDRFGRLGDREYALDPARRADYSTLIGELRALDQPPQTVVHCWSVMAGERAGSDLDRFAAAQDRGFYSLIFLAQALSEHDLTDPLRIAVVSNDMQAVSSAEPLYPERATVLGPCKVIPQEYPNITCQSIDLTLPRPGTEQARELVDQLIAECGAPAPDLVVAYRRRQRWVQAFAPLQLDAAPGRTRLRAGGVYLITGGLGQIGLVLAEYLAQAVQAKLVLVGRTALPPREEWERWLATHDEQNAFSLTIGKLRAIERLGAEVLLISADVADREQMRAALDLTIARFGALHGVLHAAVFGGETAISAVQEIGKADCELHFRPKVHGMFVLEELLRGRALDFCMLFSSLSSILGGLGFVAYAAANSCMDAFAHRYSQEDDTPWTSVNWEGWRFGERSEQNKTLGAMVAELSITPQEGQRAFEHMLSAGLGPQLAISTGDLQARIDYWVRREALRGASDAAPHARPQLRTSHVAPRNDLEQVVAGIWQELLGIEAIGVHDNFYELGGDSLMGTELVARIRRVFQVELPLKTFFHAATVAQVAQALIAHEPLPGQVEQIAQVWNQIERMDAEDVWALLQEKQTAREES